MNFNLREALATMRAGAAFTVANEARPGSSYLFETLLPEIRMNDYTASGGSMTIRATMAGLVAMDSPYPEGGAIETTSFSMETAKLANRLRLPEKALRELHHFLSAMRDSGGAAASNEAAAEAALNFVNLLIVQPHLDVMEWLRGQALTTGAIDWKFNKKRLLVDYGVPAANKLTARTGNDGYGGSASKFWTDIRAGKRILKTVRAWFIHSDTKEMIIANSVNNFKIVDETDNSFSVVRIIGTTERDSTDARDRVTFITYDNEAEILDLATPGRTTVVPFLARGLILGIGANRGKRFVIGQGTQTQPENTLGYTHLAPTIEGGNRPGRWADVYVPEQEPWALEGRGVTNGLPVIEAPEKIVILTTEMV